ncbi:MAG: pyridoxamine 5'-phosphate oxidase family protein [Nocardioidaceae bacterium]
MIPRELSERECLDALATHDVGRVAMCTPDGPRVFPTNYALDGTSLVFRTSHYGMIASVGRGDEIAFEVDELDRDRRAGWSVLAVGRTETIEDPHELLSLESNPQPWAGGSRGLYIRLRWRQLSGRAVGERVR